MLRYSILTKFLAIVLCAVCLVVCVAGAAGIAVAESTGLYTNDVDAWIEDEMHAIGLDIVYDYCILYAAEHLGNCPADVLETLRTDQYTAIHPTENTVTLTYEIEPIFPSVMQDNTKPVGDEVFYTDTIFVYNYSQGEYREVELVYTRGPFYQVKLHLQHELLDSFRFSFIVMVYQMRYHFIAMLVAGMLCFAAALVLLCCIAGRRPNSDRVYPVALNRLPLDLYAAMIAAAEAGLSYLVIEMLEACFDYGGNWAVASLIVLGVFAMALLVVAFLFAFAAQMKTKGGFWWRRTVIGWVLVRIVRAIRTVGRGFRALFQMMPLVWQWLLAICGVLLTAMLSLIVITNSYGIIQILATLVFLASILGFFGMIAYWGYCMGHLQKGITTMAAGNLHYQIPTKRLYGKFRDFGISLNSMADAARIAAQFPEITVKISETHHDCMKFY